MPAVARIFDGEKEAKLIALACSKPPKGRARSRGDPNGREGLSGFQKGGQREGPREDATGAFYGARRPA
jgi:hypothetical protein